MEEIISRETFRKLMRTGALDLSPEEAVSLRDEMNRQMDVIRQLEAIPLDETLPPVIHGNLYPPQIRCPLREDEWHPFEHPDEIIANASGSRDGYILSPDVFHQKIG